MSAFLPESQSPGTPVVQGGDSTGSVDRAFLDKVFGNPQLIPPKFFAYMVDYLSVNQPQIPVSQVFGFSQFTAQTAPRVDTSETTASTSYTNLGTVGPTVTGLPDGKYAILFGYTYTYTSGSNVAAYMGVKVNSTEPTDSDALVAGGATSLSLTGTLVKTLAGGGDNTIVARYKVAGTSPVLNFSYRWLICFRIANA